MNFDREIQVRTALTVGLVCAGVFEKFKMAPAIGLVVGIVLAVVYDFMAFHLKDMANEPPGAE